MKGEMILLSLLFFTAGAGYTMIRWGVQKSISITFYEHENRLVWYLWFLSFAVPLLPLVDHFLLFFSIAAITLVGAAPDFKKTKLQDVVHVGAAYAGIILAFVYLVVMGEYVTPLLMAGFTAGAAIFKMRNKTHWIEIAGYYLAMLGLYIVNL